MTPRVAGARLLSLTAACSSVLLVAALVGFVVGTGGKSTPATRATSSAVRTTLPLRVPEVEVTMTARPTPTPSASPAAPTATQRDRELAAVAARAGAAVDGTGSMSTPMAVPTVGQPTVPTAGQTAGVTADPSAPTDTTELVAPDSAIPSPLTTTPITRATPTGTTADFVHCRIHPDNKQP